MKKESKTTAEFYNGNDSVIVESSKFRTIREWSSSGIPKDAIKSGKKIFVAKSTLEKIKELQKNS